MNRIIAGQRPKSVRQSPRACKKQPPHKYQSAELLKLKQGFAHATHNQALSALLARLLDGTGMGLIEGIRLLVKDVNFDCHVIIVRCGRLIARYSVAELKYRTRWRRNTLTAAMAMVFKSL